MPLIKSAIKRMRQTVKRRARNITTKRNLRVAVKAFDAAKDSKTLSEAQSKIDIAVKKNLLNKNTAARKKAQLAKAAKAAGATIGAAKKTTPKAAAAKPVAKPAAAKKPAAKTDKPASKTVKKAPAKKAE